MHILFKMFVPHKKSYETCFMKFHTNSISLYDNRSFDQRIKHNIFSSIHILIRLHSAWVLLRYYCYIDYTFLCESKEFQSSREQFMLFPLYDKKLLSNGESPTWNGMLRYTRHLRVLQWRTSTLEISTGGRRTISLSLFSLLFAQLLTSSADTLFCTIENAFVLILNTFAFLSKLCIMFILFYSCH